MQCSQRQHTTLVDATYSQMGDYSPSSDIILDGVATMNTANWF